MDSFEYALRRYLESENIDVADDVSVRARERTEYGGYCETCSYEYTVLDFYADKEKVFTTEGSFADIVETLVKFGADYGTRQ